MTKDREDRKEKKEKKEKKERKERKRREAEELALKEKKISKKHKSKSREPEKPEKSTKKSKKLKYETEEEESPKKSKKKHRRSGESEEPPTQIIDSKPVVTVPNVTSNSELDSEFEFDKEDIKNLLESYSKEELINLIYKTAEKGSKLISAVFESADRDSSQRNIFVRGLGWDTTHETLKAAFEVFGEIEECSVVMDKDTGRAKGYGFILFKTRKGAREALRNPEKRMFNRTVICHVSKPPNSGKAREPVESVKIDLSHSANQSEVVLPGLDLAHGLDKGHQHQQQNMPMFAGQNMPFYGHCQPPGFNPLYGAMMGNQGPMMGNQGPTMCNQMAGLPNYRMFGSGMMNQGSMVPPTHMGLAGQYVGDSKVNVNGAGAGAGFDGERAWYLR